MALYVQKFGGTSVGTVERIHAVADLDYWSSNEKWMEAVPQLVRDRIGELKI